MDSLTHIALGSALGIAVIGRRTALWKAALWGAVCNTLPDLDTFVDHGDPIRNMTLHRGDSHALLWLTLLSPLIAWLITRMHGEGALFKRWWLAVWLALIAHPLLDWLTVYGTQLGRPFTDQPFGTGSIFIIDPMYTVPLVAGVAVALRGRSLRWNAAALAFSTAYLAWGLVVQHHVAGIAAASLRSQGVDAQRVLVTPAPFNSLLWRVVAMDRNAYHEGFYSLLDARPEIHFDRFERGEALYARLHGQWPVQRIAWFSRGFFKMGVRDGQVLITDLRMGQEPVYTFAFVVAQQRGEALIPVTPQYAGGRPDLKPALTWLWRRMWGEPVTPPR